MTRKNLCLVRDEIYIYHNFLKVISSAKVVMEPSMLIPELLHRSRGLQHLHSQRWSRQHLQLSFTSSSFTHSFSTPSPHCTPWFWLLFFLFVFLFAHCFLLDSWYLRNLFQQLSAHLRTHLRLYLWKECHVCSGAGLQHHYDFGQILPVWNDDSGWPYCFNCRAPRAFTLTWRNSVYFHLHHFQPEQRLLSLPCTINRWKTSQHIRLHLHSTYWTTCDKVPLPSFVS